MFTWNVEEMKYFNNPDIVKSVVENTSREDKVAFVDSMQDGKLSYLLRLIDKFEADREYMPSDRSYGGEARVKTVSLKAWIKRNDTKYSRPFLDNENYHGFYYILGCKRNIQSVCKGTYDTYDDLVDECFYRQLLECKRKEENYFLEHDEYSILKKKVYDYNHQYRTTFGTNLGFNSSGEVYVYGGEDDFLGEKRKITMEELKVLIDKYEKLEAYIEELTVETAHELDELEQDDRER